MMLQAGAQAPEIQLYTLDNARFSLTRQLSQGPVLLAFFKISCPTCQFTLPFLERLAGSNAAGAPSPIGVSQDNEAPTREFNRHFGIHFPVLLDTAADRYPASNAFGITNVPSLFLIDADRRVTWSLNGFHKLELEQLGRQFGRSPFLQGERIPALRPG